MEVERVVRIAAQLARRRRNPRELAGRWSCGNLGRNPIQSKRPLRMALALASLDSFFWGEGR